MEIIFKHFWIIFIAVTIVNGLILKYRSKKYTTQNPKLKDEYDRYIKGWMIYGSIPWVIVMIGNLSGITQNTFEYFNPKALNPMVLLFHLSLIILWILSIRWIYFKNGAEFIEAHPGILNEATSNGKSNLSAKQIKFFFLLLLLVGIVVMIIMWVM